MFRKQYWKASPEMTRIMVTTKKCGEVARCLVVASEKKSDGYNVVETEKKSVGCHFCFSVQAIQRNSGIGNMVKYNANENVPMTEVRNNAITT
ncbi:unnamed protein product [Cochlearia groenlandica]